MSENRLGEFLRARRDQVTPADVGISTYGRRRVSGLRREELAIASGVSPSYYVRLEQGHNRHPSTQVLDALARALRLDADATRHLHELAAGRTAPQLARERQGERVRPELARMLDHQLDTPAFVLGRRLDVLAANALACALHPSFTPGRNIVCDVFLDETAKERYADLDHVQRNAVGTLRAAAGALPDDQRLAELVRELSLKSTEFRTLWARHEVRTKIAGTKYFNHPDLGEVELDYESLVISGADRQQLVVYHADPSSLQGQALALLRTLAAGIGDSSDTLREADHPRRRVHLHSHT